MTGSEASGMPMLVSAEIRPENDVGRVDKKNTNIGAEQEDKQSRNKEGGLYNIQSRTNKNP